MKKLLCYMTLLALVSLLCPLPSFSYNEFQQDYNHPELKWNTLETPHFKVHYFGEYRYKAEEIARILENLHGIFQNRYHITVPTKSEIVVRDADISGGWVAPILNLINIDVHEFDFRMRGTTQWLQNVVTHEFSHLVSIRSALKYPTWMPDIRLGFFDYPNEKWQTNAFHVLSSEVLPQWFVEGIAQYEASKDGVDKWDTHRDMILRVSTLEDKLLTYDGMCVFYGIGPNWEKAYNQGFSLVAYIAEKYGYGAVVSMLREAALVHHQSFKPVITRVLGLSASDLYEDWRKDLKARYTKQLSQIGTQVYGKRLSTKGFNTAHPRWSTDGGRLYFVSNWKNEYGYRSLFKYDFSDTIKNDKKRIKQVLGGIGSSFSLTADEKRVLYISAKKRDQYKSPRLDVFFKEIKPKKRLVKFKDKSEIRITKNLSVLYADLSRDAKFMAISKKHKAKDWLALHEIEKGKPRYIFPSKKLGRGDSLWKEMNIYTPRLSPNGEMVAFSFFDGRTRQIGLVDTAGKAFYTFYQSGCDDRDPSWSPDGKWILFSSDRTGIFNLYKKNVKTGKVVQLTNVSGGAFYPEMSPDGRQIAYVNYDRDGFHLYLTPDTTLAAFDDKPIPLKPIKDSLPALVISKPPKPYGSRPRIFLFSPIAVGQEIIATDSSAQTGKTRWYGGGIVNLFDPLNKNYLGALLLFQMDEELALYKPGRKAFLNPGMDKEISIFYENRMFAPTLSTEFVYRTIHDVDRFRNEDLRRIVELKYAVSLMNTALAPRYQITPNQKIHLLGDYFRSSTNFYEEYFPVFNYLQGYRVGTMWTYLAKAKNTASNIAPQGKYIKLKVDHWQNELIREGTFSDAFRIENGFVRANLDNYSFNMARLSYKRALANPLYRKHIIGLQASAAAIDRQTHSFFEVGPWLKGYPFFKNRDSLYVSGNKAFQLELDYYLPLVKSIDKALSFLYFDQLYAMGFFEIGGAWNKSFQELETIKYEKMLKAVGVELRLECISYYLYPFSTYFRTSYGMDHPDPSDRLRFNFGITFAFEDWELIDIPDYLSRMRLVKR